MLKSLTSLSQQDHELSAADRENISRAVRGLGKRHADNHEEEEEAQGSKSTKMSLSWTEEQDMFSRRSQSWNEEGSLFQRGSGQARDSNFGFNRFQQNDEGDNLFERQQQGQSNLERDMQLFPAVSGEREGDLFERRFDEDDPSTLFQGYGERKKVTDYRKSQRKLAEINVD